MCVDTGQQFSGILASMPDGQPVSQQPQPATLHHPPFYHATVSHVPQTPLYRRPVPECRSFPNGGGEHLENGLVPSGGDDFLNSGVRATVQSACRQPSAEWNVV